MTRGISGLISLVLVAVACGGTTTSTTAEIVDPFGPPFGMEAAARDFEFVPAGWTVPANALLVLDFENRGAVEHFFAIIEGPAIDSVADLDASLIFRELRAGPGETTSDTFLAPTELGRYQVICTVPGHLEAGMTAELIVEP